MRKKDKKEGKFAFYFRDELNAENDERLIYLLLAVEKVESDANVAEKESEKQERASNLPFFINDSIDDKDEKSWKIKETKCRTQRIMEKAQEEGQ